MNSQLENSDAANETMLRVNKLIQAAKQLKPRHRTASSMDIRLRDKEEFDQALSIRLLQHKKGVREPRGSLGPLPSAPNIS